MIEFFWRAWELLNYYPVKYSGVLSFLALLGLWVVYRRVGNYEDKLAELALYARVLSENARGRNE